MVISTPSCKPLAVVGALLLPALSAVAQVDDDIPDYQDKLYPSQDAISLKHSIVSDPDFHKPLAYLAHYLGFGWCGGTGSPYVGEDFSIYRDSNNQYTLQARYHSGDPYAGGYWADKRLKMTLSDMRFTTDPGSLTLGEPQIYDREPLKTVTAVVYNYGDTEDTAVTTLQYDETQSWSKQEDHSFSEKISITNSYEFDLQVMGGSTEITAEFSASQGWSESNGESQTITQSAQYRAQMPPNSKRYITLTVFKQQADIPYESTMMLDYQLTLDNFLRWGGNARIDHPTNRPWEVYTFGGRNNLNAAEDILDQYRHHDIPGYSQWDWAWVLNEYNPNSVKWMLGATAKRGYGAPLTGIFETVDGSQFNIEASDAIPLSQKETQTMQHLNRTGNLALEVLGVAENNQEDRVRNLSFTLSPSADGL